MVTETKFQGWLGLDERSVEGKMEWREFPHPKPWTESDVDIEVTRCGICDSDIHTLRGGCGPTIYPVCVGHEVVGRAIRVGRNVMHLRVGDRIGLGTQSSSCLKPERAECGDGRENHCPGMASTYASRYPNGSVSYGGYGDFMRAPGHFMLRIPEGLDSANAGAHVVWGGLRCTRR